MNAKRICEKKTYKARDDRVSPWAVYQGRAIIFGTSGPNEHNQSNARA